MLSLDWNLVFTVIDVCIFYLLARRFLFQPINRIVKEREELLASKSAEAEELVRQADERRRKYDDSLAHIEEEREKLMQESRAKAQEEYDETIRAAHERYAEILKRADEAAKEEKERALKEVQNQIADLAIAAATQIAALHSSKENNDAVLDEFLKEVGEE